MPDEAEPHKRTWMPFGTSQAIWRGDPMPKVQRYLAIIPLTIAGFEPVAMLVRSEDHAKARQWMGYAVELIIWPPKLDDEKLLNLYNWPDCIPPTTLAAFLRKRPPSRSTPTPTKTTRR